jgi:RNA polymerase sigma-70 factor (ECF subfamily)
MSAPSPGTSLSLLDQLRDHGDAAAWQKMLAVYTPLLCAWLGSAGLQAADLDDVIQRTLQVVVGKLPLFDHNGRAGAFRCWLRAITVNILREFARDRTTAGQNDDLGANLDQLEDPASSLSCWWEQEHNRYVVRGLLELVRAEFAPSTCQAFHRLVLDGGATAAETARVLCT